MLLFRRANFNDLDGIYHLSQHCGVGLTTLPNDKGLLQKRLLWSCESFEKAIKKPDSEYYLFVLEELSTLKIIGTSAILALTGHSTPFYSYKISKKNLISPSLNIRNDYELLTPVNDNQEKSELGTLFLEPNFRHNQNGTFLSKSRFLFLANFPERFASKIIAEMRGVSNEHGNSPFWEKVGKHFFQIPFVEADRLTITTNKQFIVDLLPKEPIYIQLLSNTAQDVIGKPHPSSLAAMNILLKEGFQYNNYVDIFDAGPTIEARVSQIRTIKASRLFRVKNFSSSLNNKEFLISNTKLDFRAMAGDAILNEKNNSCTLSTDLATLLAIKKGEPVRLAPLYFKE